MAEGKIRVKFEAKDSDKLIAAIKSLNTETKKLSGSSAKYEKQTKKTDRANVNLRNNTQILGKSFVGLGSMITAARAKLLLGAFAFTKISQVVTNFVKVNADIEDMGRAFNNLSEAAGFSSDTFDKLNNAVDGTMRKTELMQQANNALLLGIFENSDQMANMFDVAQRLGQALGRTATESVESLVTGLGRQSKLMLDNLGIVFDTNQAYKEYAESLDRNVNTLTDQEKKQAFVNKAISIANDLVAKSGEEVLGTNAKLNQLTVSFENFRAEIGELVTPAITAVSGAMVFLLNTTSDIISKINEFTKSSESAIKKPHELAKAVMQGFSEQNIKLVFKTTKEVMTAFNQDAETILNDFFVKRHQIQVGNQQIEKARLEQAAIETIEDETALRQVLFDINKHFDEKDAKQKEKTKTRLISQTLSTTAELLGINQRNMKHVARIQAAAGLVDAYAAAQSQFALVSKTLPPPFPQIAFATAIAQGIAQAQQITKAANTPIFEQGGMVGGRRHSQGGTMIEAERGEFVMSRNAVSAIGVENLNRMNQGQSGGGGINISINGGMISPDFVENELAESIREAVRRGADFGIS